MSEGTRADELENERGANHDREQIILAIRARNEGRLTSDDVVDEMGLRGLSLMGLMGKL